MIFENCKQVSSDRIMSVNVPRYCVDLPIPVFVLNGVVFFLSQIIFWETRGEFLNRDSIVGD
jgi:hypothetical protein